ncbi:MAG: hypothetical protein ACRC41_14320 [Sarcina sp.]
MNYKVKKGFVTFPLICFLSFISVISLIMMAESIENSRLLNSQMLFKERNQEAKDNVIKTLQLMKKEIEDDGVVTKKEIEEYQKSSNENPFKVSIKFDKNRGYISTSCFVGTGVKYVEYFEYKIQGSNLQEVIFLSV